MGYYSDWELQVKGKNLQKFINWLQIRDGICTATGVGFQPFDTILEDCTIEGDYLTVSGNCKCYDPWDDCIKDAIDKCEELELDAAYVRLGEEDDDSITLTCGNASAYINRSIQIEI